MIQCSKRSIVSAVVFVLIGGLLGAQFQASRSSDDAIEQFKKMKRAFVLISGKYVEQVRPQRLAEGGLEGMLDRLDPHSHYVPPEQVERKRQRIRGSFGGIGIQFNILDDTARVVSPIDGGPSEKAGVMAGDRIVRIEDSTAIGVSGQTLKQRLKGRKGTEVTFTVFRPLSNERLTFTVRRGNIPLHSITSAYMIDDRTGYIDVGWFARSTHDEFLKKVDELNEEGMERLVLDLRQNGGGVMRSAISIADEMLPRPGRTIVKLKGRTPDTKQTWRTQSGGAVAEMPVTVLVDGNSASASEILAGALQDHDRALLVGRRTYGKGLVQKPFSLNDGSLLQLTVGAYYTPVGRFIQTPYEKGKQRDYYETKFSNRREAVFNVRKYRDNVPDSLTYRTEHGRTVFGGGGILPDYVVQPDTTSLRGFLRRGELDRIFGLFVRDWFPKHDQELRSTWRNRRDEFLTSYRVPDDVVADFWAYAERMDVLTLTSNSDSTRPSAQVFPKQKVSSVRDVVRTHVKGQLANTLFGSSAGTSILNEADPTVKKALGLWPSSEELASYHSSPSGLRNEE